MTREQWTQITTVLERALDVPAAERATVLKAACGDDLALAQEAAAYLRYVDLDDDFMAAPGPDLYLNDGFEGVVIRQRYQCGRLLGSGGFGEVWQARDLQEQKRVVLKFPRDAADAWVHAKFQTEIQALEALDHPSVVHLTQFGTSEDGRPFLVMDYVEGASLREEMTGSPWSVPRVARIIRQVAAALEHAHSRGVLHRDLKPENIILRHAGSSEERAIVVDFGIASFRQATSSTDPQYTRPVGTLGYAAPEQLTGRPSAASDIFSLGVVAFEMLTAATPPYLGLSSRRSIADARRVLKTSHPALPNAVTTAILQALASDAAERPASCAAFGQPFDALEAPPEAEPRGRNYGPFFDSASPVRMETNILKMETTMSSSTSATPNQAASFTNDVARLTEIRREFGGYAGELAAYLHQAEEESTTITGASGALDLTSSIETLRNTAGYLTEGRFRLLVLGDMNRGKTTIINVLLGEILLPSDVRPCTAVLTVLRYGPQKKVTMVFHNESTEELTFAEFRERYTIPASLAEQYQNERRHVFPDVSHAIVEYPLPLLENGVEIIDSPGLNEDPFRDQLTLDYVHQCHAILFVLNPIDQVTMIERTYLDTYLKGRGRPVFFLINQWDRIRESVLDVDDLEEVHSAEEKVRRQFRQSLAEFFQEEQSNGKYPERVFELSALTALRRQLKNPSASLEGTGFPEFLSTLKTFLEKDRLSAEVRGVRVLAGETYSTVRTKMDLRLPLLAHPVDQLKVRVAEVEPEFTKLTAIKAAFVQEILDVQDKKAATLADSMQRYIEGLGTTFEQDFTSYQPHMNFFEFLRKQKREEFREALKAAFQNYLNGKVNAWVRGAENELRLAFAELATRGAEYGSSYTQVTDRIKEVLTGIKPDTNVPVKKQEEESPAWTRWAAGLAAIACGDFVGAGMAAHKVFNWKSVAANIATVIAVNAVLIGAFGVLLGPVGMLLTAALGGATQAEVRRRLALKTMRQELETHLPNIAAQVWAPTHHSVKGCFEEYRKEVVRKIDEDIQSRRNELDNLIAQKERHEIDREGETLRLEKIERDVLAMWQKVDKAERQLFAAAV